MSGADPKRSPFDSDVLQLANTLLHDASKIRFQEKKEILTRQATAYILLDIAISLRVIAENAGAK